MVGALSVGGFVAGAIAGTRIGPALLPDGSESPYGPLFGLFGAAFGGAIMATGLEGVGSALRARLRVPGRPPSTGCSGRRWPRSSASG